eukprot:3826898-Rhodomonas_salina.3
MKPMLCQSEKGQREARREREQREEEASVHCACSLCSICSIFCSCSRSLRQDPVPLLTTNNPLYPSRSFSHSHPFHTRIPSPHNRLLRKHLPCQRLRGLRGAGGGGAGERTGEQERGHGGRV